MDSNHDKGLQRPLCCHYTTGQAGGEVSGGRQGRKAKTPTDPENAFAALRWRAYFGLRQQVRKDTMGTKTRTRVRIGTRRKAASPARRVASTKARPARRMPVKRQTSLAKPVSKALAKAGSALGKATAAPRARRATKARAVSRAKPAETGTPKQEVQTIPKKPARSKIAKPASPRKPRIGRKTVSPPPELTFMAVSPVAEVAAPPAPTQRSTATKSRTGSPRKLRSIHKPLALSETTTSTDISALGQLPAPPRPRKRSALTASNTLSLRKTRGVRKKVAQPSEVTSPPLRLPAGEASVSKRPRQRRRATTLKTTSPQPPRAVRKAAPQKPELKIPAILLEGDHPAPTLLEGPGERFALNPNPAAAKPARVETQLPEGYGTQRLFLTARDPEWLYAHWDLTRAQQRQCNTQSTDGHLVLRVYSERVADLPLAEVHVHPESRYWFVHVGRGGAGFAAELGYYRPGEIWTHVATSEPARTPVGAPSSDKTVEFATIPTDVPLPKLIALTRQAGIARMPLAKAVEALRAKGHREFPTIPAPPPTAWTAEQESSLAQLVSPTGASRTSVSSMETSELMRGEPTQPLDWAASAGEAMTSPSSPFGGEQAGGKAFWFTVNAELIIYGATEPSATVTIGGRPIELQPDGSFSYRFALPDGCYELPVVAISADNTDGRTADLWFGRETSCCGAVGQHPQDPTLQPPTPENV